MSSIELFSLNINHYVLHRVYYVLRNDWLCRWYTIMCCTIHKHALINWDVGMQQYVLITSGAYVGLSCYHLIPKLLHRHVHRLCWHWIIIAVCIHSISEVYIIVLHLQTTYIIVLYYCTLFIFIPELCYCKYIYIYIYIYMYYLIVLTLHILRCLPEPNHCGARSVKTPALPTSRVASTGVCRISFWAFNFGKLAAESSVYDLV